MPLVLPVVVALAAGGPVTGYEATRLWVYRLYKHDQEEAIKGRVISSGQHVFPMVDRALSPAPGFAFGGERERALKALLTLDADISRYASAIHQYVEDSGDIEFYFAYLMKYGNVEDVPLALAYLSEGGQSTVSMALDLLGLYGGAEEIALIGAVLGTAKNGWEPWLRNHARRRIADIQARLAAEKAAAKPGPAAPAPGGPK